jgi:hypothetical protein
MKASRWGLLLAGVAACTFPDVTYSDSEGGVCPELAGCESIAQDCDTTALQKHADCLHECNGQVECETGCNYMLGDARATCAVDCEACAPPACGNTTSACQTAAGFDGPY